MTSNLATAVYLKRCIQGNLDSPLALASKWTERIYLSHLSMLYFHAYPLYYLKGLLQVSDTSQSIFKNVGISLSKSLLLKVGNTSCVTGVTANTAPPGLPWLTEPQSASNFVFISLFLRRSLLSSGVKFAM